MEPTTSATHSAAGEVTHWQVKWGTPQSLWVGDIIEVRGFGHLVVDGFDLPRLAACVGAQDESTLVEMAHAHLKALTVQALQAALYRQNAHSFPGDSGALPPECIEQLTGDVSAGLHVPLSEMGLALGEFVMEGGSYHYCEPQPSHLRIGGDECPPRGPDAADGGFKTPSILPGMLNFMPSMGADIVLSTDLSLETLTSTQVADSLKITEAEVIQLIESGQLNALKIGAEYRILKEWVEDYRNTASSSLVN